MGINIELEELAYLYELHTNNKSFTFIVREHGRFLVTTINEKEKEGWDHEMLNLIAILGDPDNSTLGFNPINQYLPWITDLSLTR